MLCLGGQFFYNSDHTNMALNFNQAMNVLAEIGDHIHLETTEDRNFVDNILSRHNTSIAQILTERNKGILLWSVWQFMSTWRPIPEVTLKILRAIYLLQNQELQPSGVFSLIQDIKRNEILWLLEYSVPNIWAKVIPDWDDWAKEGDELDELSRVPDFTLPPNRMKYYNYVSELKKLLWSITWDKNDGGIGFAKKQVLMPFITLLLSRIETNSEFDPTQFSWADIVDGFNIMDQWWISLKVQLDQALEKKWLQENLLILITFFESYCTNFCKVHEKVSSKFRRYIKDKRL